MALRLVFYCHVSVKYCSTAWLSENFSPHIKHDEQDVSFSSLRSARNNTENHNKFRKILEIYDKRDDFVFE